MIVECEDGDFDFFDIVIDWGEWVYLKWKQDQEMIIPMNSIYSDGFDYIGL